jgi:diguanylate cyclase (GGDEF)-like protein
MGPAGDRPGEPRPRTDPALWEGTVDDTADEIAATGLEAHPCLLVVYGNDRGKHFQLEHPPVTIGRSPEADITLNDNRISRVHCSLHLVGSYVYVEDNDSRNGTFVDGNKITRSLLAPESELRIGRSVMRVAHKAPAEVEFEEELFKAAVTDPLTGIPNRRWFMDRAVDELATAVRHALPLAAVFIDIDHFKQINDTYGHQAGDHVLREIASVLDNGRREEDLLCRYGGEEFVLVLRHSSAEGAANFCERARAAVEERAFTFDGKQIPVTISVGATSVRSDDDLESLLGRADAMLYRAKEGGRNRVVLDEE